ncbi:3-oxoacyl-ACP synthase III family protein [Chitinophaga qingshengii]|uniref:Ketoacyl-ACP synthase III n=1 Tax=Chitinophaga qingshengii TaxID=1569794 RepID=A0ABR7TQE6_9BACT|nr:beta-ketoacyl-ACP synthase III [Chitinophaga qingshengii]MBC9932693.1 ketoacyl-ACP synthase III [Chitinophaga qingshengii]
MEKITAAITAVGGWVPEFILTNAELVASLDTTEEWIESRLGIKERRILKGPMGTSRICLSVAEDILRKRGMGPEELDLMILATSTPDRLLPCTSNLVCHKLGATNAWSFDVNLACSGFMAALDMGARYIESGMYKKVMVIGADHMSAFLDYNERLTSAVFADGGGGVLLEPDYEGYGLLDSVFRTDGSGYEYVSIRAGGSQMPATMETVKNVMHVMHMEPKGTFKFAVSSLEDVLKEVLVRNALSLDQVTWLVPHQANKRILETVMQAVGLAEEKVMINIDRLGNTCAGTIPLCLWDYEKQLKKGDHLLLASFGAGFTWGAGYLKWAYDGTNQ